jgi:AbrB family looped-hinge helix DNA binding protein
VCAGDVYCYPNAEDLLLFFSPNKMHPIITCVTIITNMKMMNQPRLLGIARLNEKGQLVIPKEAREFLGIGPGDRVLIAAAPFRKAIFIARPEDVEEQLQTMVANTEKTIVAMRKKLNK